MQKGESEKNVMKETARNIGAVVGKIRSTESIKEKLELFSELPIVFWNLDCMKEILGPFLLVAASKMVNFYSDDLTNCKFPSSSFYSCFLEQKETGRLGIRIGGSAHNVLYRIIKFLKFEDKEVRKAISSGLKGLSNDQIADGIFSLIDCGLIKDITELKKYFADELIQTRAFSVRLLSLFFDNSDLSFDRWFVDGEIKKVNDKNEKPKQEEDDESFAFNELLNEFFIKIKQSKETKEKKLEIEELCSLKNKNSTNIVNGISRLFDCGIIKNYRELKMCFGGSFNKYFNGVFIKLIDYNLGFRLKNKLRLKEGKNALVPKFDFQMSDEDIKKILFSFIKSKKVKMEIYNMHVVRGDNVKWYYKESSIPVICKEAYYAFEVIGLNPDSGTLLFDFKPSASKTDNTLNLDWACIIKYLALFAQNDDMELYRDFFNSMVPYSDVHIKLEKLDGGKYKERYDISCSVDKVTHMRKLFMFLCAKSAFGFPMISGLDDFLIDLKLDKERMSNAFCARFGCKGSFGFDKFYSLLTSDNLFSRSLTNLGIELYESFAYAMMKNLDSKNIEEILCYELDLDNDCIYSWEKVKFDGTVNTSEMLETCINLVLNGFLVSKMDEQEKLLKLDNCATIKSILALVRMRCLALHKHVTEYGRAFENMFCNDDKGGIEINHKFKTIFDEAFNKYIDGDKVKYCDLVEIYDYNEILKLNKSQLVKILSKVLNMDVIDDQKQKENFVNLLMNTIDIIETLEEKKEESESIPLNEEKEKQEPFENKNRNENKSLFKRSELDAKKGYSEKPRLDNGESNESEKKLIGKKHKKENDKYKNDGKDDIAF